MGLLKTLQVICISKYWEFQVKKNKFTHNVHSDKIFYDLLYLKGVQKENLKFTLVYF